MAMAYAWTALLGSSLLFALWTDTPAATAAAAMAGAGEAAALGLKLLGPLMLWSGIMELLRRSGLSEKLAGLLSPLLRRLFPASKGDRELLSALSINMSANLLGLGNAATPAGIRAAKCLARGSGRERELSRLVVLNTASLQLLPNTVAALRSAAGAASPYDIQPAVWLSSAVSVCAGLGVLYLLERWS